MNPVLSLVIPFYNEEDCVARVVSEVCAVLNESGIPFELIAVQNGSQDRTAAILNDLAKQIQQLRIVQIQENQGFGFGIISGLKQCSGEIVGYMVGDGQIPPDILPRLVRKMKAQGAQIGKGCRVVRNDEWIRKIITKIYNTLMSAMFHLPTSDVNSTPKMMTLSAYQAILPRSYDWFIDPEILLKAKRLGFQFCEEEVVSPKRIRGRSKLGIFRVSTIFLINLLKIRFLKNDPWEINSLKPRPSLEYIHQ